MSPESISSYHKQEAINQCFNGINNCPIPVLVEYPDGQEFPIIKAYKITGRTAAIKILVNCEGEIIPLREKIEELEEAGAGKENKAFRQQIFDKGWLNIENLYAKFGWHVTYDKPAYCETY